MDNTKVPIEELSTFLKCIKGLPQPKDNFIRFYRGQPVNMPLIPNAFREDCFKDNESEIYNEIVNKKPEEFVNCKCTFDYLVKMQHYNIPTRLLDITSNPLIALFFSLSSQKVEEPTVYCLDIPIYRIKNYTSDNVTILSTLARYDKYSKEQLIKKIDDINELIDAFAKNILRAFNLKFPDKDTLTQGLLVQLLEDENKREDIKNGIESGSCPFNSYYKNISIDETLLRIRYEVEREKPNYNKDLSNIDRAKAMVRHTIWNVKDDRLLHEIKQDKPYFLDLMYIETFNTIYCVKPKFDNPRIIKQNGAFLLFPHAKIKLQDDEIIKLSISKSHKSDILEDLSRVDISTENLYNDMDRASIAIKEKYRKPKSDA